MMSKGALEQRGNQIFILKQEGEKAQEKKGRVYVGFIDLGKAYDRFNRKALS